MFIPSQTAELSSYIFIALFFQVYSLILYRPCKTWKTPHNKPQTPSTEKPQPQKPNPIPQPQSPRPSLVSRIEKKV